LASRAGRSRADVEQAAAFPSVDRQRFNKERDIFIGARSGAFWCFHVSNMGKLEKSGYPYKCRDSCAFGCHGLLSVNAPKKRIVEPGRVRSIIAFSLIDLCVRPLLRQVAALSEDCCRKARTRPFGGHFHFVLDLDRAGFQRLTDGHQFLGLGVL
jgi:hypothetical protein